MSGDERDKEGLRPVVGRLDEAEVHKPRRGSVVKGELLLADYIYVANGKLFVSPKTKYRHGVIHAPALDPQGTHRCLPRLCLNWATLAWHAAARG